MLRVPPILAAGVRTTSTSESSLTVPPSATALLMSVSSLHQFLNGWIQGLNAYEMRLGKYHNVDCPK